MAGASNGKHAIFAGGGDGNLTSASSYSSVVDAYDKDLVRTIPQVLSVARQRLAGASQDGYAIFAGGTTGSVAKVVDAYDDMLMRSTPTSLPNARMGLAGASIGSYALFAGGYGSQASKVVDIYQVA